MLDDFLQEQAALYASGHMPAEAREQFEALLACMTVECLKVQLAMYLDERGPTETGPQDDEVMV